MENGYGSTQGFPPRGGQGQGSHRGTEGRAGSTGAPRRKAVGSHGSQTRGRAGVHMVSRRKGHIHIFPQEVIYFGYLLWIVIKIG